MSGMLTGDAFTRTFPEIDLDNGGSASLQGLVVSIYEIGCFVGALVCLFFGEYLGRRWSIMIGCTILSVGAVLQAAAFGIPQMIIGRIVAGIGNGMNTSTIRTSPSDRLYLLVTYDHAANSVSQLSGIRS